MLEMSIILASSSPQRKKLLAQIGVIPDQIIPANIDETPNKREKHIDLVNRLSKTKCLKVADGVEGGVIIAADTIVTCKGKLLDKAIDESHIRKYLKLSSGSRNQIYTSVYIIKKISNQIVAQKTKLVKSTIKFKGLTDKEIDDYASTKEGVGNSGGFAVDGCGASYMKWMKGSFSGIVGLPLNETRNLLISMGYDCKVQSKN